MGGDVDLCPQGAATEAEDEDEEVCSICQEGLFDLSITSELGEALETACGHFFYASCYMYAKSKVPGELRAAGMPHVPQRPTPTSRRTLGGSADEVRSTTYYVQGDGLGECSV